MENLYESPLPAQYANTKMKFLFSSGKKFRTWCRLWIALVESEVEPGLPIAQEQIDRIRRFADDINYNAAGGREKIVCHDAMAHMHMYGEQCLKTRLIIHLGATSCYVGDSTDIIVMTEALWLLHDRLVGVTRILSYFATEYRDLPTLAFTHYQPTQSTAVGKHATLWIQDLLMDLEDVEYQLGKTELLGSKGTIDAQASFSELPDGDYEHVKALDRKVAEKMGYSSYSAIPDQTYSRKPDSQILSILSGTTQSATEFSGDIRLLQHMKEVGEPFKKGQIGPSAMVYKRNSVHSECTVPPVCYVIVDSLNLAITTAIQWFKRTLNDPANKCLSVPEAFLTVDGVLDLYSSVVDGLAMYPKVIEQYLLRELLFMATENIMMDAVKCGADHQQLHEQICVHSMETAKVIEGQDGENDLLDCITVDSVFGVTREELSGLVDPSQYTGCATVQTQEFVSGVVNSILKEYDSIEIKEAEINL